MNSGKEVRYGNYFFDGHEVTENEVRVYEFHGKGSFLFLFKHLKM